MLTIIDKESRDSGPMNVLFPLEREKQGPARLVDLLRGT